MPRKDRKLESIFITLFIILIVTITLTPLFYNNMRPRYTLCDATRIDALIALKTAEGIDGVATYCLLGGSAEFSKEDYVKFMVRRPDGTIHFKKININNVIFHDDGDVGRTVEPYVRWTLVVKKDNKTGEEWFLRLKTCDIYVPASAIVHEIKIEIPD